MARGLDHIVHAVRDLDAAGELYQKLGFTVGARNKHSWGTHNRIVQFDGAFIELLTLAEPEKLGNDGFAKLFGGYTGDFLAHEEGLSLLILESHDAVADEKAFGAAGVAASKDLRFEREAKRPDGSSVKVGFSLAFAEDKLTPKIHFASCQQHYPENFWNPAFQNHANGVKGIAGVVMVADHPARHREFLLAFSGVNAARGSGDGFTIDLPRGAIDTMTPAAFTRRYGQPAPDTKSGARLAAIRFAQSKKAEIVPAMGAVLAFEAN